MGDWVKDDGCHVVQAASATHLLMAQCQRIATSAMGYVGREDLAPGLRMAALGRYVIFFRLLDGVIRIEHVLHSARNLPVVHKHDSE